jgi:predicted MFS family arabinose efflux permease
MDAPDSTTEPVISSSAQAAISPWQPFGHAAFAVIWTATVVSNIGTWMYSAASGWLMTSLSADPLIVSMVQVATSLPMVLLALPAGALADIVDRRRLLLAAESATTLIAALFALFVWLGVITPLIVLLFTFLISVCGVLTAPAWQAIVPQLVPKRELAPAVTANSVGFNISRAIGPALGGAAIAGMGIAAPFWSNAISNIGVLGALVWWRAPKRIVNPLPAERLGSAMVAGVRYGWNNPHLRATLARAVGFFFFASAYWALLPLVARVRMAGGPELYGILLGAIGAGAVAGAFLLRRFKARIGPDGTVTAGTFGTAVALALFGIARGAPIALVASVIAGMSWIIVLATLNISAQVSLPEWVRGRGLAFYMTLAFGALTLGSAVWGKLGELLGLPIAHFIAAAGALGIIPMTRRWKLQIGAGLDLTPSSHWPVPVVAQELDHARGPVLVTVDYRINPHERDAFLAALSELGRERRRDGAYAWGIFEDVAERGCFRETFFVESWLEHLRQHQRVTNADRLVQDAISKFQISGEPKVSHFIAAETGTRRIRE